jgi:hypothetical protein
MARKEVSFVQWRELATRPNTRNNRDKNIFVFGFRDPLWVSRGTFFVLVPRFPSKSGLMNKHIVKHIVILVPRFPSKHIVKPSKSGQIRKHIVNTLIHCTQTS